MKKLSQAGTVAKISGTNFWIVYDPFYWYIDYETKADKIIVPRGFKTDFGSVPRIFWSIIDPTEWNSYLLHDKMYTDKEYKRSVCDKCLLNALLVEGCSLLQASTVYIALRLFGWLGWYGYLNK